MRNGSGASACSQHSRATQAPEVPTSWMRLWMLREEDPMPATRSLPSRRARTAARLFALGVVVLGGRAEALTYQITPVNLVASGVSFTGTVTTDGTIEFTITPANSELNDTVFRNVTASADDLQAAFPDGNFQFNLISPFTTTV